MTPNGKIGHSAGKAKPPPAGGENGLEAFVKKHVDAFGIEWAHCDAAGIVFYPRYYEWFDQGTERLFASVGLSYGELAEEFGISGMPLLETGAKYKNACRLGARVRLASWVDEISGKTFVVRHRIESEDGDEMLEGFERRIMVKKDPQSPRGIRAVDLPAAVRERLAE